MEYLERIANADEPPLPFSAIESIKSEFDAPDSDQAALRSKLQGMEVSFRSRGDLSSWTPELLDEIDACFVKNYIGEDGEAVPCLFFPDSPDNLNLYISYCSGVDHALRTHFESAPRYARAYFSYYSVWQMRGFKFPVPLGTKSVVDALNKMAKKLTKGFSEVSRPCYDSCPTRSQIVSRRTATCAPHTIYPGISSSPSLRFHVHESALTARFKVISWIATLVSWAPRLNSKVFISRDQFNSMISTVATDPFINKVSPGVRRKVRPISHSIPFLTLPPTPARPSDVLIFLFTFDHVHRRSRDLSRCQPDRTRSSPKGPFGIQEDV